LSDKLRAFIYSFYSINI